MPYGVSASASMSTGVFLAFLPRMIEDGGDSLIAISSMTGKRPLHGRTPYAAAKMAVIGRIRTLATETGSHGTFLSSEVAASITGEDANLNDVPTDASRKYQ